MTYTFAFLLFIGFLGIISHNLMKMNSINKSNNGNFNFSKYIKYERFSIILSVIVVIAATFLSQEIKQLSNAGMYLGIGLFTIGYASQSILVSFMNKVNKTMKIDDNQDSTNTDS